MTYMLLNCALKLVEEIILFCVNVVLRMRLIAETCSRLQVSGDFLILRKWRAFVSVCD